MAEFIYSTRSEIDGPILLDRSQLENLDDILNKEWERFNKEYERATNDAAEELKRRGFEFFELNKNDNDESKKELAKNIKSAYSLRKEKKIEFIFADKSVAIVEDFKSAFRDCQLQDKDPIECIITLESVYKKCCITLSKHNTLEIEVSPRGDTFIQETFTKLKYWQDKIKPPLVQSFCHEYSAFLCIALAMLWMFLALGHSDTSRIAAKSYHKQQAEQIISSGVTSENHHKATELLLAQAYDVTPKEVQSIFPKWFTFFSWGSLLFCVAIFIKPKKIALAVGIGEKRVSYWRNYYRVILFIVPGYILSAIILPKLIVYLF